MQNPKTNKKILILFFSINFQNITDFGITGNAEGYPISRLTNLEKFDLYAKSDGITDSSIQLIERLKSIKKVNIPRSECVSDEILNFYNNKIDSSINLHNNCNYVEFASLRKLLEIFN